MTNNTLPLSERTFSSYSKLTEIASELNVVSDELGSSITLIDDALRKLNLGVTAWVQIYGEDGDPNSSEMSYWSEEVGYAKVNGKWGVCLRRLDGDYRRPDEESETRWLFNDAPRPLRLAAIDKIPELLESLSNAAAETSKKIQAKLEGVKAVAAAMNPQAPAKRRTLLQSIGNQQGSARAVGQVPLTPPEVAFSVLSKPPLDPLLGGKK